MPIYSRKAKYEDLRKSLQNDSEASLHTPELSAYEQRLNKIAPAHFEAPEAPVPENLGSVQPRRAATYPTEPVAQQQPVQKEEPAAPSPAFSNQLFQNSANYTTAFKNEYIDDYIKEVKKYNIDQGNAISANTDLDILRNLRNDKPRVPSKPYPDEEQPAVIKPISQGQTIASAKEEAPAAKEQDTADISFTAKPAKPKTKRWEDEMFIDDADDDTDDGIIDDPRTMTKDDIAAEVQRLINGSQKKPETSNRRPRKAVIEETDDGDFYSPPTREQILNETSIIRSQMVDYEDNLNDVNDKMHRTNQILNIVLIILIIALALVLAVVVYWVLLSKGVIS